MRHRNRILLAALALATASCTTTKDTDHKVVISVPDQRMAVFEKGVLVAEYPVSTSKFGVGSRPGSFETPLGHLEVAKKIGAGARPGSVFRSRHFTGEVLRPDAPGRDPIVTRIIWLKGLDSSNYNAFARCIYIHGTPEERKIGTPASYGCIRMRSRDIVQLFDNVGIGASIQISNSPLAIPQPSPEIVSAETKPAVEAKAQSHKTATPLIGG